MKGKESPWLNRDLKSEMNNRDFLQSKHRKSKLPSDFKRFQTQRNKVNTLVRKAKAQCDLLKDSLRDCNRFRSVIKKVFPTKEHNSTAKTLLVDNKLMTNTKEIASGFCSFLTNVASILETKAAPLKDFVWGKKKIKKK